MNYWSGGHVYGTSGIDALSELLDFANWTILCVVGLVMTPGMIGMVFTIPMVTITNAIVSSVLPSVAKWLCHWCYLDPYVTDGESIFALCTDVVKIYLITLAIHLFCKFVDYLKDKYS